MEIKELTKEEMGSLIAGIHQLSKDRLREMVLQIWQMAEGYEEAAADKRRLVRELDVLLNGKNAAKQASLCDIVCQMRREAADKPPALSAVARQYLHSYTDGAEADCREYDPDTGKFGNEELADEIEVFRIWLGED